MYCVLISICLIPISMNISLVKVFSLTGNNRIRSKTNFALLTMKLIQFSWSHLLSLSYPSHRTWAPWGWRAPPYRWFSPQVLACTPDKSGSGRTSFHQAVPQWMSHQMSPSFHSSAKLLWFVLAKSCTHCTGACFDFCCPLHQQTSAWRRAQLGEKQQTSQHGILNV